MITPLAPQILQANFKSPGKSRVEENPGPSSNQALNPGRPPVPAAEGLASSIMADGGLGFLRSRLEDKLESLFEKAAADNPQLAAAGPEAFFDTSVDVSPEATADRIVGFALGLKSIFSQQNPDLDEAQLMANFESEIRRGIGEGFGHARDVLGGLELLDGQVKDNVDATWDLVQQKLEDFFHPPQDDGEEE